MITMYFFPIGLMNAAPVSFPVTAPNLDTARLMYDALVAGNMIPASVRP